MIRLIRYQTSDGKLHCSEEDARQSAQRSFDRGVRHIASEIHAANDGKGGLERWIADNGPRCFDDLAILRADLSIQSIQAVPR